MLFKETDYTFNTKLLTLNTFVGIRANLNKHMFTN